MKSILKIWIAALFVCAAIFTISCNSDDDASSTCEDIFCTAQFVTLSVSIQDENQEPVALDSILVTRLEDGSNVTISLSAPELETAQQLGQYPLVNDAGVDANQEAQLQFKGFIDGEEVISRDYTVGADCCHVSLVSGDLNIVL